MSGGLSVPEEVLTARQNRTLSHCEEVIERDLRQELQAPTSRFKRWRKTGEELMHSPAVLFTVVVLNCLDCLLVLSELVLDVYFINEMIKTAENTMERFNKLLLDKYPDYFAGLKVYESHKFYNRVLQSTLLNNITLSGNSTLRHLNRTMRSVEQTLAPTPFVDADDPHFLDDHVHSMEEKVAHTFHKASITILGILVIYTFLKVFCQGLSFVKHKLQVFDGIVVIVSFTLDVCYINGLTNYPIQSFILILALMIPWRIIRVLNSLVIAVKDNFQLLLKLMYKKYQYQKERLEHLEATHIKHKNMIAVLTRVCESTGLTKAHLDMFMHVAATPQIQQKKADRSPLLSACFSRKESVEPQFAFFQSRDQHKALWETVTGSIAKSKSVDDVKRIAEESDAADANLLTFNAVYNKNTKY